MKLNVLASAVGCAVAALSSAAIASPLSSYNAANTASIYATGSSALDPAIARLASRACQPGTLDTYGYSNLTVYFCQPTAASGISKPFLVFEKYSANGSYNGIVGVAEQSTFAFIDMSLLTAATGGTNVCPAGSTASVASVAGVSTSDTIGIPAYTIHSCATSPAVVFSAGQKPQMGFADVEPSIFGSPADISKLTTKDLATQIFAVPLTIAARNALITTQIAQGTIGSSCSPTASANTNPSTSILDTLACMPSLPRGVLTAMYNGSNIVSWSQLGVTLSDDNIYVARRSDVNQPGGHVQSGSQATFEALVTSELCSGGLNGFGLYSDTNDKTNNGAAGVNFVSAADCDGSGPAGVPFIWGGSGTGDVQLCMEQHQAAGRGAVGILGSLDVPISASAKLLTTSGSGTSAAGDFGYRFVKVDGAAPTVDQVASGAYPIWVESTLAVLTSLNTGDVNKLYTQLSGDFSSLTVLQDVNKAGAAKLSTTTAGGFGTPGLAELAPGTNPYGHYPITAADVVTTPINLFTRQVSAGAPNSCQPGQLAATPL